MSDRGSHIPTVAGVPPPSSPAFPSLGSPRPPIVAGAEMTPSSSAAVPVGTVLPKVCPTCLGRYPADFNVCPRDAVPLEDARGEDDDPFLGATLADSYQITRVLGEGGMGRVYEARHTRLANKRFAIKMLHPEYARQPEVVTRFQREAEAASGIAHPNVVDVYDVLRTPDGRPYIVGELLEGQELGEFLSRVKKVEVPLAVRVVRQVCRALAAAHAKGVVHRDMKPENVFLTGDPANPTVKVLDFGISKIGDAGTALTKTGMIMGTPGYMAPEQARGDKVDHRVDVYAVGAILYRALTGRKPFEGDDTAAILTAVLTEDPPRPCSIEPSIPEALELVVQRAMAKKPDQRYPTMAALEADLEPFDTGEPLSSLATGVIAGGGATLTSAGGALLDTSGKTMLAGHRAAGSQPTLARATRDVKLARPMITFLSVVGYLYVVLGLVDAVGSVVRLVRGSAANLTGTEALLITIGIFATTVTPAILWIRHLARGVWENSHRAVALAETLRRVVVVAVAAYGIASLLVRIMEATVRQQALDVAWPVWSLVTYAAGLAAGAAAYLSIGFEKRDK